jgi:hypothetical protein
MSILNNLDLFIKLSKIMQENKQIVYNKKQNIFASFNIMLIEKSRLYSPTPMQFLFILQLTKKDILTLNSS